MYVIVEKISRPCASCARSVLVGVAIEGEAPGACHHVSYHGDRHGLRYLCIERGLPGRTIPVPGEVAAGCGLAWKALPADEELLRGELAAAGVPTEGFTVIDMWEVVR